MRKQVLVCLSAATLAMTMMAAAPARVAAQQAPPPSALVNQEEQAVQEAARKVSPHTADDAMKFFESEVARKTAEAAARVWDPNKPRTPSPRTTWGDPDLRGY